MSDPEALRREMQTEAAEFVRRREVARITGGTRLIGSPEIARSRGRPATVEGYARLDAEREGCKFAPERDPCFNCGVRRDLHDDAGCKRWRAA